MSKASNPRRGRAMRWASACTLAVLAGCNLWPVIERNPSPAGPLGALDYYAWLRSVPGTVVESEQKRIEGTAQVDASAAAPVQLALLLSAPLTTPSDEPRARRILEGLDAPDPERGDPAGRDFRLLGRLWRDVLADRASLRTDLEQLRLDLERQREWVRSLQVRNDDLRRQIDQLKVIEQKINRRGQARDDPS